MANEQNLRPWKPGKSGNPAGKPKGTKHLSTHIRELMEDENFTVSLSNGDKFKGAPIKAIISALIIRALEGDAKAFDALAKYGYGTKPEPSRISEWAAPVVYLPKELPPASVILS